MNKQNVVIIDNRSKGKSVALNTCPEYQYIGQYIKQYKAELVNPKPEINLDLTNKLLSNMKVIKRLIDLEKAQQDAKKIERLIQLRIEQAENSFLSLDEAGFKTAAEEENSLAGILTKILNELVHK